MVTSMCTCENLMQTFDPLQSEWRTAIDGHAGDSLLVYTVLSSFITGNTERKFELWGIVRLLIDGYTQGLFDATATLGKAAAWADTPTIWAERTWWQEKCLKPEVHGRRPGLFDPNTPRRPSEHADCMASRACDPFAVVNEMKAAVPTLVEASLGIAQALSTTLKRISPVSSALQTDVGLSPCPVSRSADTDSGTTSTCHCVTGCAKYEIAKTVTTDNCHYGGKVFICTLARATCTCAVKRTYTVTCPVREGANASFSSTYTEASQKFTWDKALGTGAPTAAVLE